MISDYIELPSFSALTAFVDYSKSLAKLCLILLLCLKVNQKKLRHSQWNYLKVRLSTKLIRVFHSTNFLISTSSI